MNVASLSKYLGYCVQSVATLDKGMVHVPSSTEWDDRRYFIMLLRTGGNLKLMNYLFPEFSI